MSSEKNTIAPNQWLYSLKPKILSVLSRSQFFLCRPTEKISLCLDSEIGAFEVKIGPLFNCVI